MPRAMESLAIRPSRKLLAVTTVTPSSGVRPQSGASGLRVRLPVVVASSSDRDTSAASRRAFRWPSRTSRKCAGATSSLARRTRAAFCRLGRIGVNALKTAALECRQEADPLIRVLAMEARVVTPRSRRCRSASWSPALCVTVSGTLGIPGVAAPAPAEGVSSAELAPSRWPHEPAERLAIHQTRRRLLLATHSPAKIALMAGGRFGVCGPSAPPPVHLATDGGIEALRDGITIVDSL
mmetsp:Transcript_35822/g.83601  ORF Transcript_35822/g.83601 Transcript_35822/m.83601 type:complete len:238 (-) Transcript_35822:1626-2339(-)